MVSSNDATLAGAGRRSEAFLSATLDPDHGFLIASFRAAHGREPCFDPPGTLEEFILWRMIFDQNPLYTYCTDKVSAVDFVSAIAGSEYLVPRFAVASSSRDIDFSGMPERLIVKVNHGCGQNIIVSRSSAEDMGRMHAQIEEWLGSNLFFRTGEWQYRDIRPAVLVEQLLEEQPGQRIPDYKFHCFSGRVEFVRVVYGKPHAKSERMYDRDWRPQPYFWAKPQPDGTETRNPLAPLAPRPIQFEEMVHLAEKLAAQFSFVRVDLYNLAGQIYFGELTFTPYNGRWRLSPEKYGRHFASLLMPERGESQRP